MTYKEYKECLNYELYRLHPITTLIQRLRVKYLQPNTACMHKCRLMWYLYSCGGKIVSRKNSIFTHIA